MPIFEYNAEDCNSKFEPSWWHDLIKRPSLSSNHWLRLQVDVNIGKIYLCWEIYQN